MAREGGLTFFEMSYMLLQSYDFFRLYCDCGCNLQFGGDDQWSNMLGGTELIRKKLGKDASAMTITLLTKHDGTKMGKTAGGAVWLDPEKTSPYDFYQYWRNVEDADVMKCIRMLTFLPLEEIDKMDTWEGAQLNTAKEILAYELTKMIHGEAEAEAAQNASRALFGAGDSALTPSVEVDRASLVDGAIDINSLLVLGKMVPSKSEGRRAIEQGGVTVEGEKVTDVRATVTAEQLTAGVLIKRGKKSFAKFILK
jgi:tyrosyl-tRNA synthetase